MITVLDRIHGPSRFDRRQAARVGASNGGVVTEFKVKASRWTPCTPATGSHFPQPKPRDQTITKIEKQ